MKDEDKKERDQLLSSKKLSPEQKAIISLNSQIISGDLVNMRGHMVVLHTLDALAITMKILEISITSLEKRSLPLGVSESKEKSEKNPAT